MLHRFIHFLLDQGLHTEFCQMMEEYPDHSYTLAELCIVTKAEDLVYRAFNWSSQGQGDQWLALHKEWLNHLKE